MADLEHLTGPDGLKRFLAAFRAAPNGTDIEFGTRVYAPDNEVFVTCAVAGICTLVITIDQARGLADCFDETMRKFANEPGSAVKPAHTGVVISRDGFYRSRYMWKAFGTPNIGALSGPLKTRSIPMDNFPTPRNGKPVSLRGK